ncbi:MAG: hypothetical protein KME10_27145 [Plectolyngbya sp. WJT66-NPBG17]|nr:hypothetical protein [Plectolyngbya sp. WJT66-NPBG17]
MSFILTIVFLLGQIDPAVAHRNSILYDKAQQAQSEFLTLLEPLVNIDSGTGNQTGLTQVENLVIQQLESIGATVKVMSQRL